MSVPASELMVGYLIKRVQQALRRRSDAALHASGLSMAQYSALRALDDHPEASAADLARLCFVTRQSLQDVLTGLRGNGFVVDGAHTRGRSRSLQLTAEGRRALAVAAGVMETVEAELTQDLSPTARDRLVQQLIRCAENLEG